jgi:hypothetical protein
MRKFQGARSEYACDLRGKFRLLKLVSFAVFTGHPKRVSFGAKSSPGDAVLGCASLCHVVQS